MYLPREMKELFTGNRSVTSKLIPLSFHSFWTTVTSTDTGLNWTLGENCLKISVIFTLRSSIDVYLRHATSPAGINFLDLLNLIPMIMVKRKAETVKDKSVYLRSHFSQWTIQEHGDLSKVTVMFWYEVQFNKIVGQRNKSIKFTSRTSFSCT